MSKEAFNTGSGDGTGSSRLGYNPVNVPAARVDDSGIIKPVTELKDSLVAAENLLNKGRKEGDTPKKLVNMADTTGILKGLHTQLTRIHSRSNAGHPDVYDAGLALHGDKELSSDHSDFLGAADHLHMASMLKATQTPLAWENLSKAAAKIHAAHLALSQVSPEAKSVAVTHSINGIATEFTPGAELLHIAKPPAAFREFGDTPNRAKIGNRVLPVTDIRAGINRSQASDELEVRPEVLKAAKKKIRPVKRGRKIEGRLPSADPKAEGQLAEPLGITATDLNRTGDWSGSENTRGMPESVIPKVDKQARKGKGK
jgi:hypothetical protein